jgi:hypothetical protein
VMVIKVIAYRKAQPFIVWLSSAVPLPELLGHVCTPVPIVVDHRVTLAVRDDAVKGLEIVLVGLDPQLLITQEILVPSTLRP